MAQHAGAGAYFTELTATPVREYFRPNFWPNTPDILHAPAGRRAPGVHRAARARGDARRELRHLRAGRSSCASAAPAAPGSEEYLDSEKYQTRHWEIERADSLMDLIARVNRIRHEHPALQRLESCISIRPDNQQLICYSKTDAGGRPWSSSW